MQTQRDHVDAYRFQMRQVSSALVLGDVGPMEPLSRRALAGVVGGVVVALLVGVGVGVYGFIRPGGSTAWRDQGAIVVEKETGSRSVYRDGRLHPVLNYASALLLEGDRAHVVRVSSKSLRGVRRGPPVGIPGAPETLPDPSALVGGPWLVCLPAAGAGDGMVVDLTASAAARTDTARRTALVASAEGRRYVVWGGRKMAVEAPAVTALLGMATLPVVTAPDAWLAALTDGPPLAPPPVPGLGGPGPVVAGRTTRVGDLFRYTAPNGHVDEMVALRDGLAAVSATELAMLEASGDPTVIDLDDGAVADAPRSAQVLPDRVPDFLHAPSVDATATAQCLEQRAEGARTTSRLVTLPQRALREGAAPGNADGPQGQPSPAPAHLAPGTGMLVAQLPAPTGRGEKPDRYLVTDEGLKYPLVDDAAITALGYGGLQPVPVEAAVLASIPSGPALSRSAAGADEEV